MQRFPPGGVSFFDGVDERGHGAFQGAAEAAGRRLAECGMLECAGGEDVGFGVDDPQGGGQVAEDPEGDAGLSGSSRAAVRRFRVELAFVNCSGVVAEVATGDAMERADSRAEPRSRSSTGSNGLATPRPVRRLRRMPPGAASAGDSDVGRTETVEERVARLR